jgi:hypothetical protein
MMLKRSYIAALISAVMLFCQSSFAASAKTYQVTGSIVEVNDKVIVVQKGDERWEIAREPDTRVKGNLKVGQKVTVHYRMNATSAEVKSPAASDTKSSKN